MQQKTKTEPRIEETAVRIVTLLKPLSSENRARVISAALTLLGEPSSIQNNGPRRPDGHEDGADRKETPGRFLTKAKAWIRQSGLTEDQLGEVFDVEGVGTPVIASTVPGDAKEKVHNAYVLCGISYLLATGEAAFKDDAARVVCKQIGCYDGTNHSTYLKKVGNLLSGSKKTGWRLTGPGLKRGADVIKELTKTTKE